MFILELSLFYLTFSLVDRAIVVIKFVTGDEIDERCNKQVQNSRLPYTGR